MHKKTRPVVSNSRVCSDRGKRIGPVVQLSGESAGLPQPQLGTKIPHQSVSLEASGVFRFELIWCYDRWGVMP